MHNHTIYDLWTIANYKRYLLKDIQACYCRMQIQKYKFVDMCIYAVLSH